MEDSIGRPVVNGILMVELGNSRIRRKWIASISERKALWSTQSSVHCGRDRSRGKTGFLHRIRWWIHDSDVQQNWSRIENALREVGELVRKKGTHSCPHRKQHFDLLLEPRSEINRD